jgi:threonine dehydratase
MADVDAPRLEPADLDAAWGVITGHLRPTPLVPLRLDGIERPLWAKLETTQPTGSFKVRGALAACAAYGTSGERIVTASAGNHGLGIAYAATRLGIPATVVVPETASPAKVERLRRFGIDLRMLGADYDAAEAAALEIAAAGGRFVSAYNDPQVIAGQATVARELLDQIDQIDQLDQVDELASADPVTVLVPVGGGGLVAGVSTVLAGRPGWRVVGVEAEPSRAVSAALAAGRVVSVGIGPTIADGLAGNLEDGSITPRLIAATGTPVCAAPEAAIRAAVAELATGAGLVVEGSGAVGLAALRAGRLPAGTTTAGTLTPDDQSTDDQSTDHEPAGPIVLLLTGRNIAAPLLAQVIAETLGDP